MSRYPLEPLMKLSGAEDMTEFAAAAGVTRRSAFRYQAEGLSINQADRVAVTVGFHPLLVWPEWGAP